MIGIVASPLAQKPKIILADEPVSSLDPKTSRQIMRLVRELVAERWRRWALLRL